MSALFSTSTSTSSGSGSAPEAAMGGSDVVNNLMVVRERIAAAAERNERPASSVDLVAVSKTKPSELIHDLYTHCGQRKFGENYFQELLDKAAVLPGDIEWHFIGHLQSQKASKLVRSVPNLAVVETVDSLKLAGKLNSACEAANRTLPLSVFIQVDTSGEDTKSGVEPAEVEALVRAIQSECPKLIVKGLMTIGAPGDMSCFHKLANVRKDLIASGLGWTQETDLALSMGMSGDFEEAIAVGATSVRVGSTIFGARIYPTKDK
jgi:pyridoxal phosphate enzyme (YggS family)